MAIKKELVRKLLKACERVYAENIALKSMFLALRTPGWQEMLNRAKADPDLASLAREQFAPLYQQLEREQDFDLAIADLLRNIPPSGGKPN